MLEVLEYINKQGAGAENLINRELSWLSFNARVLQEAADERVPLLERLRFLGIFSNNLDEFFRVRVATIKRMSMLKKSFVKNLGSEPSQLLSQIQETVLHQQEDFNRIYKGLIDELEDHGIHLINEKELTEDQGAYVQHYFHNKVWPALIPIMIHDLKEFPVLQDKSIYLAIKMWKKNQKSKPKYSLLEIPTSVLPRFLVIPSISENKYIIMLDDIIRYCLSEVFAILEYDNYEAYTFKITRDAEIDIENDVSKSFLEKMSKSLKQRKKGQPVRFVYDVEMPKDMLQFFMKKMKVDNADALIPGSRYHNFKDFMDFPDLGDTKFEYERITPLQHPALKPYHSILNVVGKQDVMLHYPYQGFSNFIDLLREAAIDPKVKSIKITIYRLAKDSRVVNALINAAKNGKRVVVILELQARFDEKNNIKWSSVFQEEGVTVLHGIPGLKVHSKLCLITRKEGESYKNYASIGTGNYNEKTSGIYSDLALFTSDERITNEASRLFELLEGTSHKPFYYRHLVPSPMQLRNKLVRLINAEIRNAEQGKAAYITIKTNSLVDPELINKLYDASKAGVKIRLIVRGICSLIPGKKGLSENIEAISIVDKFLEHARVFIFGNAGKELIFISSADWMGRNLDSRIEVTAPIYDSRVRQELRDFIEIQWKDNQKARILDKNQQNKLKGKKSSDEEHRSQFELYEYYKGKLEG